MFNKYELRGNWNQLKGEIKKTWGKLTNDPLTQAEGDYDILIGMIQERWRLASRPQKKNARI